ncbi:MAG: molybdopterin-dependent oxidoreductase [Pseudomonadota bacterium]
MLTSSHWGIGVVETRDGRVTDVRGHGSDPNPSPLNGNIADGLNGRARIQRPAVRAGWLDGKGERGRDAFVEVSLDRALDLIAAELTRVKEAHGNEGIFAGSYGWASAGRFHHAQSQLKRFLNCIGGFVRSEGNYSYNAALVALPHIIGGSFRQHLVEATRWPVIAQNTDLVVAFGGLALRNMEICDGGASRHRMQGNLAACVENGVRFVNLSPLRTDIDDSAGAEWLPPRPGTDVAVMMGMAHTLLEEGLHDQDFLDRYTVGFDRVAAYLRGVDDGVVKSADWAAEVSGLPAKRIRSLAREMATSRTMISCAAGLQRADWGEQPLWMTVTLAAMLGQIGLPGGGYTIGYAVNAHVGNVSRPFRAATLPQGENAVNQYIPVAMVSEMLLNPGASYRYDGQDGVLPDARLVWWAGGNPFHHHQDLNRLRAAFQRPDTVIVNEINWTATARHADIVLPVASALERRDFGAGRTDNILVPMQKTTDPVGQARVEYDIYADLADRMGVWQAFTQGRDADAWLRHMWDKTRAQAKSHGHVLPDWDSFLAGEPVELPDPTPDQIFLSDFRDDPAGHPRETPSGRLELFSATVAGFGLADCPGHATWNPPKETPAKDTYPLALLSGQPGTRLHSQFDNGAFSQSGKVNGREPILMNPQDADARNVRDGDLVEVFNKRGRLIAGAQVTPDIAPGTVFLWTGAWFDPDFEAPNNRDRHGNPNVLTHDLRTSEFTQSPAAHSAQVDLRPLSNDPGAVQAFEPPQFVDRVDFDG